MLQSMGSQRVRHDWATEQQQQQYLRYQGGVSLSLHTLGKTFSVPSGAFIPQRVCLHSMFTVSRWFPKL